MSSPSRTSKFSSLKKLFVSNKKRDSSSSSLSLTESEHEEENIPLSKSLSQSSTIEVFLLDSDKPLMVCTDSLKKSMQKSSILVKDIVREVCKQKGIKPFMVGFFNLQLWKFDGKKATAKFLIPTKTFEKDPDSKAEKLVFRYQFKVLKGREIYKRDLTAFKYYLSQCRHDFCSGVYYKQLEKESKIFMRIIILLMKVVVKENDSINIKDLTKTKYKKIFNFEEILQKNPENTGPYDVSKCRNIIEKSLYLFNNVTEPDMDFITEIEYLENFNIEIFHLNKLQNKSKNPIEIWITPAYIAKRVVLSNIRRTLWQSEYKYLESCHCMNTNTDHGIEFSIVRAHEPPEIMYCPAEDIYDSFCSYIEGYYQLVHNQYSSVLYEHMKLDDELVHGPISRETVPKILSLKGRVPGNYLFRHYADEYDEYVLSLIKDTNEFSHLKFTIKRDENDCIKYIFHKSREFNTIKEIKEFYENEENSKEINCILKNNISPMSSGPIPFYQDPSNVRPPLPQRQDNDESVLTRPILLNSKQLSNNLLAEGSYGKVYLVPVPNGLELVCRKIELTPPLVEQWIVLSKDLQKLDNPNLVKFFGVDYSDEINIFFEYLSFGPLPKYISLHKNEILLSKLLKYVEQIGSAIKYLHSKDLIHGHIFPRKILVQNEDCVKLNYPSLSVHFDQEKQINSDIPKETFRYFSPEVISSNKTEFTKASDVWSFGITIWEIFSSREAFSDFTYFELKTFFETRTNSNLPSLKSLNMDIIQFCNEYFHEFFNTALNNDLKKRMDFMSKVNKLCSNVGTRFKAKKYFVEDWTKLLSEKPCAPKRSGSVDSGNYTEEQSSGGSVNWNEVSNLSELLDQSTDHNDNKSNPTLNEISSNGKLEEQQIMEVCESKETTDKVFETKSVGDDKKLSRSSEDLTSLRNENVNDSKFALKSDIIICERHSQSLPPSPTASGKIFRSISMEQSRSEEKQIANILVDMQRGSEIQRSNSEIVLNSSSKSKKVPPPPPDSPEAIRREIMDQPKKNVPSGDMTRRYLQERINKERDRSYGKRAFSFDDEFDEYKQNTKRAAKRALLCPNPFNLNMRTPDHFFLPSEKVTAFKPLPKDMVKYFEESKKNISVQDNIMSYKTIEQIREDIRAQSSMIPPGSKLEEEYKSMAEVHHMMKTMKGISTRSPSNIMNKSPHKSEIASNRNSLSYNSPQKNIFSDNMVTRFSLDRPTSPKSSLRTKTFTFHPFEPKKLISSNKEKLIKPKPNEPVTHISQIHIPNSQNINVPILINNGSLPPNSKFVRIPPLLHRANTSGVHIPSIILTRYPTSVVSSTGGFSTSPYCIPGNINNVKRPHSSAVLTNPVMSPESSTPLYRQIERKDLTFEQELGEGFYGKVHKGSWSFRDKNKVNHKVPVAIKSLKETANTSDESNELKLEAEALGKLSGKDDPDSKYIVKLFGVCEVLDPAKKPLFLMVTEYAEEGSLLDYTLKNKSNLSSGDLLYICKQIACGMRYLHSKRYIHRDLACRNVLVFQKDWVKLCDFGLSRMFGNKDYYKSRGGVVPIRWLALESIEYMKFTYESDYWSFGVLIWELFSLHHPSSTKETKPFADVKDHEVADQIRKGRTLSQPEKCPEKIWVFASKCWNKEPKNRPNFDTFVNVIHSTLMEMNFTS